MIILFFMMIGLANQEFFEMVDRQTSQGYTWERVGRTVVTDEIAFPVTEQDGTDIYYWYLTKP
jgi:hypothetical protein